MAKNDRLEENVIIETMEGFLHFKHLLVGYTTRFGGVSSPPLDSLNMSFQRSDALENVMENYRRLGEATGVATDRMVRAKQVHNRIYKVVHSEDGGIHESVNPGLDGVDALITSDKNLMILTTHADCVPVYLYDKKNQVIAMVHAGWGGTVKGICKETVKAMIEQMKSQPEDIIASFGPHIGVCCFEVGEDLIQLFKMQPNWSDSFLSTSSTGKMKLNLQAFIRAELRGCGLQNENIHETKECTKCQDSRYFSHRGSHGNSGCGVAFMMIRC
jgi:YfiH family protein